MTDLEEAQTPPPEGGFRWLWLCWRVAVDLAVVFTLIFTAYLVWWEVNKYEEDRINYAWSVVGDQMRHNEQIVYDEGTALIRVIVDLCSSKEKDDFRSLKNQRESNGNVVIVRMLNIPCQVEGAKADEFDFLIRSKLERRPGDNGNVGLVNALNTLYGYSMKIAGEEPNNTEWFDATSVWNNIKEHIFTKQTPVRLTNLNLNNAYLHGLNLSRISLENANLSGAELSEAKLFRTILVGVDFSKSSLVGADLSRAYLSDAKLVKADLSYADLSDTHLENTKLNSAILTNAKLCRARLFNADLTGADLTYANLTGADLTKAKMSATLFRTQLREAQLDGAEMKVANSLDNAILCHTIMPNGSIQNRNCEEGHNQSADPCR